ncbi:Copine, partial [Phytophthora palmivora]
ASNGPPNDPRSLHFIDPRGPNQYQHAISSTVSILQEYDADKKFPVYGFGGIPPGAYDVDHCFPLNLNPSNPEVAGYQGVLQWHKLTFILFGGNSLINQSMRIATQLSDPRKQKYFVLLIITDGAIMDMQGTIDALVEASHSAPLSIVIIGVGPADFSSMVALDGDGGRLRASNGRVSARDIVQFVPYNRFVGYPDALTRETLAEIPHQLCQYMKFHHQHSSNIPRNLSKLLSQAILARGHPKATSSNRSKPTPKALPKDTSRQFIIHSKAIQTKDHLKDLNKGVINSSKESIHLSKATLVRVHPTDINSQEVINNREVIPVKVVKAHTMERLLGIRATVADRAMFARRSVISSVMRS